MIYNKDKQSSNGQISNSLLAKLKSSQTTTYGMWITMESPTISEIAVTLQLDWVCIDMEHGHLGHREVMEHLRALRGSTTTALVRVPNIEESSIKRALDMGAHGVVLPLVRTKEDVVKGMNYGRYATDGKRGIGGERAVKWGLGFHEYLAQANKETMIIPMIETKESVEAIDEILSVPGIDAIFFGPADLSATYGYLGQWEGPGVAEKILEVKRKAAAKGIASGVVGTNNDDALMRRDQGFNMVGLGSDAGLMIKSLTAAMDKVGGQKTPHLWF